MNNQIKRRILPFVLAVIMILASVSTAFAVPTIEMVIAGAKKQYPAGGSVVVTGKISDAGVAISSKPVVRIVMGEFVSMETQADKSGYFQALLKIPENLSGTFNIDAQSMDYSASQNVTVVNASAGIQYIGTTFDTNEKAQAGKPNLGVVFDANVNYFNNKFNDSQIELGVNENNADCITLINSSNKQEVPVRVTLAKNSKEGGVTLDYYTAAGSKGTTDRKKILYIEPLENLAPGASYYINVDKSLSANSGDLLGQLVQVHFATSETASSGGGGGAGGTTAPPENNTKVEVTTEIKGEKAETKITDAQITEALKNTSKDGTNNLVFEVKDNEISGKDVSELSLGLTGEQAKQLVGKAANVVYSTPMGEIKLPVSAFEGTSGNVSLTIAVDKDSPDTYIVTLSDSKGKITTFKDAVTLKFSAKDKNAGYNVFAHDGKIMKNAKVIDGVATGKTKGFSSFAFTSNKRTFPDIQNHWAKGNIESLASRNMIDGKSENSFDPDAGVTRAEFIKMIVNSVDNLNAKAAGTVTFTDIPQGKWYSDCVLWAAENKIVNGIGNGNFGPNQKITRQDMCVIIEKASESLGIKLYDEKAQSTFVDDDKIADYAKQSVYKMQKAGIVSGKGNNAFEPKSGATRAEASKIIDLLIDKLIYQ